MPDEQNIESQKAPLDETWSLYMRKIYVSGERPSVGTFNFKLLEEKARVATKGNESAFMYTFGSAGLSSTDRANCKAFERWRIIPRMLRNVTNRSLETTIFGVKYRSPIFVAPVGVQTILHKDGALASARAAANVGVPYVMSTASSYSIEQVAAASGRGQRWFQLYWPYSNDITLSLLSRAKENGFTALVVTLDTFMIGWRPHDLDKAYLPFLAGPGTGVGLSDPVFMKKQNEDPQTEPHITFPLDMDGHRKLVKDGDSAASLRTKLGTAWLQETGSGVFRGWEDVKFLRDNWDGPLVLKGIQSLEDVRSAMEAGVDGVVVSNHGGRQIDGAIPSLVALETICADPTVKKAQEDGKLTILFDSGIRVGSDVIKAVMLGAQGVFVGRPMMYGLAVAGQEGVEDVLRGLLADTEITLGLSGYGAIEDIWAKREVLARLDWLV